MGWRGGVKNRKRVQPGQAGGSKKRRTDNEKQGREEKEKEK